MFLRAQVDVVLRPNRPPTGLPTAHKQRRATTRQSHPRAYHAWTPEEEAQLLGFAREGTPPGEIAAFLRRQPSATISRLARLAPDNRRGPAE